MRQTVLSPRSLPLQALALCLLGLALPACGQVGSETAASAPSFCPTALASRLQATPGVNSPPSAYYQSLSAGAETTIRVTLLACDPDHPSTSAGLSWSVIPDPASSPAPAPGPSHGTISAVAGTYPDAIILYEPVGGFIGSDSFWYQVVDAHGATSNAARILVDVRPVPVSLAVSGPSSAVENTTISFTATADWIGSSPSNVTSRARWTENSPYASFRSPGVLAIGDVPSDQTVTVTAVFTANGASVSDTFAVSVVNVAQTAGPLLYIWDIGRILSFDRSNGQVATLDGTIGWWSGAPVLFTRGLVQYYDGNFYFSSKPAAGGTNLWRINPLGGGATQVASVTNFLGGMSPSDMTVYEGRLYLAGYDSGNALQLWSYDQSSGMRTVTENSSPVWPLAITPIGGKLAFSGIDTLSNFQLRAYDSASGFSYLTTEPTSVNPVGTLVFKDHLCFNGADPTGGNGELWCYDPAGGLVQLTDTAAGINPLEFEVLDGVLYFVGGETYPPTQLWATTGDTPAMACSLAGGIWPVGLSVLDGRLYFMGSGAGGYDQLFRYDPSSPAAGAVPVTSFATGFMMTDGTRLVVHDGRLYFSGAGVSEGVPTLWSYNAQEGLVARKTGITWSLVDAMGIDPAQPPAADLTGTWTIENTTGNNDCGDPVGVVSTSRAAISQRGGDVTIDDDSVTWNAFMQGGTVRSRPRTYPDGGGFTTESFVVAGDAPGIAFSGATTWTWTDGSFTCSGTCSLKGTKDVAGAWRVPSPAPPSIARNAYNRPVIRLAGNGDGMVAWSENEGVTRIGILSLPSGPSTMGTITYLDETKNYYQISPVAFDVADDGSAIALWQVNDNLSAPAIRYATYSGTAWSAASTLAAPALGPYLDEPVALDLTAGGNAIATWKEGTAIEDYVRLAWFDRTSSTWDTTCPAMPNPNRVWSAYPSVAAFGESIGYGVYKRTDGDFDRIVLAYHLPASGWASTVLRAPGINSAMQLQAASGGGVAAAAWQEFGDILVWVARDFPATLGTVYTLPTSSYGGASTVDFRMAVDGNGAVTVAWTIYGYVNWKIYAFRNVSGSTWDGPTLLNAPGPQIYQPALCANALGQVAVVWWQEKSPGSGQMTDIYSSWYEPSRGWGEALPVKTGGDEVAVHGTPSVDLTDSGEAAAAWLSYLPPSTTGTIWVTRRK